MAGKLKQVRRYCYSYYAHVENSHVMLQHQERARRAAKEKLQNVIDNVLLEV